MFAWMPPAPVFTLTLTLSPCTVKWPTTCSLASCTLLTFLWSTTSNNTCKRKTKVVFEAGTSISPSPSQPPGGKFAPGRCNTWSSKQITNRWLQIKPHLRPRNCRRNASRESHHTLESWSTFYSVAPIWQFRNNGGRSTVPPNLKAGYYQMRKNIIWYVQSSVRIPD